MNGGTTSPVAPDELLSTAPQNKVTIIPVRHSRILVAGIQKESLDASLRGHAECKLDIQLCGAVLRAERIGGPIQAGEKGSETPLDTK